ncbi:histidine kinase [Acidovorax sp. Leaf76]|uniref:sensor histidine kinase n=1 Tax=unclassified Acidovorax TaxID=2684926 RepID=UPI0006F6C7F8|nr:MULTISPECIES: HAMP domain-containing sensor histidine kinase [unclassified Acidovorax]KQO14023.1 histidine kinase [Acidovorax sp. Leaf76]KQO31543.1 histidine kinase [Acidovorax sp. Leaf84]KQS27562.1 histidine kinase [Acidovorax sp. Leaf191]
MKRLLRRPALEMPRLEMPRLGLPAFRLRILVRSVFLLLAAATVALSVVLLKEEKERAWQSYQNGFKRSQSEVMARLRHPSGQLALLNAHIQGQGATPLAPLLLPYAAIDFDDQNKAQQAVEMAGCAVQYPDGASACAAIGNNPYAGGFIYLVGSFYAGELVPRERGALDLAAVHRARVTLDMRGTTSRWVAPFEALPPQGSIQTRGRLTGFADVGEETLDVRARPVRDFRGWLWQSNACRDPAGTAPGCLRRTFYSIRLPVELFREALFGKQPLVWPPEDLGSMRVRVEMLGPAADAGSGPTRTPALFDSNTPGAQPAASLADVARSLLPGEKVQIRKLGSSEQDALTLRGTEVEAGPTAPWLIRLISWLPLDLQGPGEAKVQEVPAGLDILDTPLGNYAVTFTGNLRGVEQGLAVVATRMSWYLGAMLAAIALAWLAVEVGLLRRVTALTRRAAAVSYNVQDGHIGPRLGDLDVSDLRGSDELGILAGGLADLLQRVKDDIQREQLRAQQERDMWHAVGHEIMSPLQSLMVLHGGPGDPGHRYVQRMQQAVHVLYGTASPAEALQAADLPQGRLDLDAFLRHVADNAHFAGIGNVVYQGGTGPVVVRADEFALEDVVTHILGNADRYRPAGTAITLTLKASESTASATLHNQGSTIEEDLLGRIFELGVSDPSLPVPPGGSEHRGQGLFVAKTYMAKMGGTVNARNTEDGVAFTLTFQRLG